MIHLHVGRIGNTVVVVISWKWFGGWRARRFETFPTRRLA
jgi:hypothetical protein